MLPSAIPAPFSTLLAILAEQATPESVHADLADIVIKAGAGAMLIAIAGWAIGRFNNALSVSLSSTRTSRERDDVLRIVLKVKKLPPTRICFDSCDVTVRIDGDSAPSEDLRASLTEDLAGMTFVPGDQAQYEATFVVPARSIVLVRVRLTLHQLIFDRVKIAKPSWSCSAVSLPPAVES
jgi:hypothetical protein